MNCENCQSRLSAYLDRELTGSQMIAMRQHIDTCQECRFELESLREVSGLLTQAYAEDAPFGLEDRILSAVDAAAKRKTRPATSLAIVTASAAAACVAVYLVSTVFSPIKETPAQQVVNTRGFDFSADQAYQVSADPFSSHVPVALPAGSSRP